MSHESPWLKKAKLHLYNISAKIMPGCTHCSFTRQCFQCSSTTHCTLPRPMTYQDIHLFSSFTPTISPRHVHRVVSTGHFTPTLHNHNNSSTNNNLSIPQLNSQTSRLSISTSCRVKSKSLEHATCWSIKNLVVRASGWFFEVSFSWNWSTVTSSNWDELVEEEALKTAQ